MIISRRKFLGRSSVVSAGALLTLAKTSARARSSAPMSAGLDTLSRLSVESFAANLNTTFQIHVSALNVQQIELIEVSAKSKSRHYESFGVVFEGKETQFAQGTYQIEHERMGSFPLFVVPLKRRAGKLALYHAVLARVVK